MFNTLLYAKRLIAIGYSREQAEAHVEIIAEIVEEQLVTKQDFRDLETRFDFKLQQLESRIVVKIGAMFTAGLGLLAAFLSLN